MQADSPLNSELIQRITALDGVKKVTEIKNFGVLFDYPKNDEYNNNDEICPLTEEETISDVNNSMIYLMEVPTTIS